MKNLVLFSVTAILLLLTSCDRSTPPEEQIPTTYNFANVDYSGQTTRLAMLGEMTAYMKTGNSGAVLDAAVLKAMYANDGSPFGDTDLNASTKQLKSKTFALDQDLFEDYMDNIALASTSTVEASNGTAGVLTSASGTKSYLVDENGIEYTQLIEKGLMGAVFYYQALDTYLSETGMDVDNQTVEPGKGTEMEHHWDEAFGYTAFPIDFHSSWPESRDGELTYWAKYCNGRDDLLQTNETMATAFRVGRHALSSDDYEVRDAQIAIIQQNWELVSAATAIHYINGSIADFADDALRCHQLSEAHAFVRNLRYNPAATMSIAEIDDLLATLGSNFYTTSVADLQTVKDELATKFGLTTVADAL